MVHLPRLDIVAQNKIKIRFDNLDQRFVKYWKKGFDPVIEVSRHDIGAAEIELLLAAIMKVVSAAVLKKTADDAYNPDIIAYSRNSGLKTADAANDEINADPLA